MNKEVPEKEEQEEDDRLDCRSEYATQLDCILAIGKELRTDLMKAYYDECRSEPESASSYVEEAVARLNHMNHSIMKLMDEIEMSQILAGECTAITQETENLPDEKPGQLRN